MSDLRPAAYAAHKRLVNPGRARPELWRLLVGLAIVGVVVTLLNLVLFALVSGLGSFEWAENLLTGASPVSMLVLLTSFAFVTFGVSIAARRLQHRSLRSILGPRREGVSQFLRVFRALVVVGLIVAILPPYDMGATLTQNLALSTWLLFLPLSLMAVLIQTSAEEVLFRGYMQQSLAARFRSPIIWMGLPSFLFAAGHFAPGSAGDNAFLVAVWSGMFGLLAADLTARSGTLGPAIALHLFNNMVALLFISLPDGLSGLALYLLPNDMSDTGALRQWLYVDFAVMIVSWLTARVALRR
ncbi:CPBP family intramembrane glutamic endopeptidase [Ruegeria sp. Ofav3-42]|uniref:CPBP family intramembrane glutamic endopeptidase n=1 Tax=Ruegeria sp. Ofav3-42 TaxID=2917759 RepID=UPI001EF74DB5|nr:CPBP family intramembrane glutamic endopeptidase [Ruegeria sp. Ofav3-42]MCG7521583.1 CPBP family intramembrane metalloprotease [Ruegeria sp. Ofav3-42]